jgi:hypothetical protein
VTFEMVTFELPTFVTLTVKALLFPTATLPKLKLGRLADRTAVDAIPIPLRETVLGVLEILLMMETSPAKVPAAFGEKMTFNVDWFPASITRGSVTPVIVTPAEEALALVIVRLEVPLLEMVTDCETVPPSGTEPKLMEAGATEIAATLDVVGCSEEVFGAPVTPMHPEQQRIKRRRKAAEVNGIALFPGALKSVACFFAPRTDGIVSTFFISAICGCGMKCSYCPNVHLWYRNKNLNQIHARCNENAGPHCIVCMARRIAFLFQLAKSMER